MKESDFSISPGKVDLEEIKEGRALAEKYFGTIKDPDQIPTTEENSLWFRKKIPTCFRIIRHKKEIIGFSIIIPAPKKLMEQFVSKKITEKAMFEIIKKQNVIKKEAIYFCSVFVKPEYRGRGLALQALTESIRNSFDLSKNPPLFYWAYSQEGDKLARKLSQSLQLPLNKRIDN